MIRILNFINLKCGGAETTVMNYYNNIDRNRIQFDFLLSEAKDQFYENEAISLGAHIYRRPMRTKSPWKNAKMLYNIIKSNPEIKIVHLHNYMAQALAIDTLLTMIFGIPVRIVHSRCVYYPQSKIVTLLHRLFRPILRATATHWIGVSTDAGVSLFGTKAIEHKKFSLMPNARDLNGFRYNSKIRNKMRKRLDLDNKYVLIAVGRLVNQKNCFFLLDSFFSAYKSEPNITMLIAGDGELYEKMIDKINELKLSNAVKLLGRRNDISDLLQAADLFIMPSLFEGLPGAAIEAQAAGLPCLISDTVTKECKVIDAVEFLPINNGPNIWAERILAYRSYERRDTYNDVRNAGYDIRESAKRLEEFYFSALKDKER